MTEKQYDVLVIGGGPGGTPAAMVLAKAGKKVLLVEAGDGLGGTCLFEGCIPSKIFRETARRLKDINESDKFGITLPSQLVHFDWRKLKARKHEILKRRSDAAFDKVAHINQLDLQFGHAQLQGAQKAKIEPHKGDEYIVHFEQCIIATGSKPTSLPLRGADLPCVYSSDSILDIDCIPEHLTIIGGGPIGVELAQVFHTFGAKVTLLEQGTHILKSVDGELALSLEQHLINQGIDLKLNVTVNDICHTGKGMFVNYHLADGDYNQVFATAVLASAGRQANIGELGLENTSIVARNTGIEVDAFLQTQETGIYAVGDVVGQPMFAHWATAQGLALARHLLGQKVLFPLAEHNSAVIFSTPQIGMVGLTEGQAIEAGINVAVARYDFTQDARAQIGGADSGVLTLVYQRSDRKVIGAHVLHEEAADLIGEAATIVRAGLSLEVLASAIHPHPTLSESFVQAARMALSEQALVK